MMQHTTFTQHWIAVFRVTVSVAGGKSIECRNAVDALLTWLTNAGLWEVALTYVNE